MSTVNSEKSSGRLLRGVRETVPIPLPRPQSKEPTLFKNLHKEILRFLRTHIRISYAFKDVYKEIITWSPYKREVLKGPGCERV